jgi:hypothetical protein
MLLAQVLCPAHIDLSKLLNSPTNKFNRSHISHMRIDRIRRLPGYLDPKLPPIPFGHSVLSSFGLYHFIVRIFGQPRQRVKKQSAPIYQGILFVIICQQKSLISIYSCRSHRP